MHVLVMNESWSGALSCIQSFGRKGHTVSVVAGRRKSPNCRSRFVKNIVSLPIGSDDLATCRNLIELTEKLGIDVVVPISDHDAQIVALAKEQAQNNEAFVTSSVQSIETARSRNSTTDLCHRLGIPTPPTVCASDNMNVTEEAKDLGFPLFVKASGSFASEGTHFASSPTQLNAILGRLPKNLEFQLQKQLLGDYIGITGFAAGGELTASFAFRAKYQHSFGGSPPYITLLEDRKLEEMLSKITTALNWTGGIDLDFIETGHGQYVLLEINPRLSGTANFPLKLGIDLPSFYLTTRTGEINDPAFATQKTNATGFINLMAEAYYMAKDPSARRLEAREFRETHIWSDDMYWDDRPLALAIKLRLQGIAWMAWLKK